MQLILRFELEACTDPRLRWALANWLIHTDNGPAKQSAVTDEIGFGDQFSYYFVCKTEQLRFKIVCKLSDTQLS